MYSFTHEEKEQVLQQYCLSRKPLQLSNFPAKEKRKYILITEIIHVFDENRFYTEKEINALLKEIYVDYAIIRRYLVDYGFLGRKTDGSSYWVESFEPNSKSIS
jgi:hypothetical protein